MDEITDVEMLSRLADTLEATGGELAPTRLRLIARKLTALAGLEHIYVDSWDAFAYAAEDVDEILRGELP